MYAALFLLFLVGSHSNYSDLYKKPTSAKGQTESGLGGRHRTEVHEPKLEHRLNQKHYQKLEIVQYSKNQKVKP